MKVLRVCLAVAIFSGITAVAATQQPASGLQTPTAATATASKSQHVKIGGSFTFQLILDQATEDYPPNSILWAWFNRDKLTGPPPRPPLAQDGQDNSYPAPVMLQNDQKIYNVDFHFHPLMLPGHWKLTYLKLGERTIPVSGDISFDIPELPPLVAHVHAPKSVEAGKTYVFSVTLDQNPKDFAENCPLRLVPHFTPPIADWDGVILKADQLSYEFSYSFSTLKPASSFKGELALVLGDGQQCQSPLLKGDLQFAFDVLPDRKLVTPTSAVAINPSLIDLLKGEADRLRAKAQHLKQQLTSGDASANRALLQKNLQEALNDLESTEESFKQKGAGPSQRDVTIFFDDIRRTYAAALKIANGPSLVFQTGSRLIDVKAKRDTPLNAASEAAVASIERNISAYDLVASTKIITFTLAVYSSPDHAVISYRRDGDDDYQPVEHDTDWKIEGLPRAFYYVRLQKKDCDTQEKPFDAMRIKDGSIHITLECKGVLR